MRYAKADMIFLSTLLFKCIPADEERDKLACMGSLLNEGIVFMKSVPALGKWDWCILVFLFFKPKMSLLWLGHKTQPTAVIYVILNVN